MNNISLYKKIYLFLISLMILIPACFTDFGHDRVSELDNRMLVEFDEAEGNTVFEKIDVYLEDRIGFRDELLTLNEIITDKLFHKLIHPFYIYGKNNEIFTEWDLSTFQHKDVSQEYVDSFSGYMKGLNDFCNSYGAGFLYIMVPSKETIYPEYYANGYEVSDRESRSQKIHDALTKSGVKHIYLKDVFETVKTEKRLYNKYYDVGHWNANGIYHCMEELSATLSKEYPEIRKISLNDFNITRMKQDYLPLSHHRKEEMIPVYTPKIDNLKGDGMSFFGKELVCGRGDVKYKFHSKREGVEEYPKILVFNDSFFEESDAEKYFLNQYSELTMVHVMNLPDIEYYVSSLKPDIVILEGCERSYESEGVYDLNHLKKRFYIKGLNEDEFEIRQLDTELTLSEGISEGGNKSEFSKVSGHVENLPDPDMLMTCINGETYYAHTNRDYYDGNFVFSINRKETDMSDYDGELIINCMYEK